MNAEIFHTLAAWAARTSLEALPLAVLAALVARWRGFPVAWRWALPALFFLRLAMPSVPTVSWHAWPSPALATATVDRGVADSVALSAAAHTPLHPLVWIWFAGVLVVAGWLLFSHWKLRRWIAREGVAADAAMESHALWAAARMGLAASVPLRVLPGISTLAVCGWLRPAVLVPADLEARFTAPQIRGMLLHEMAHVRRRDVLWTWLALGLCALHWFNPLAWLALRRFHADRELACDAAALRALDGPQRHEYGEALLRCLQSPALPIAPAVAPFFRHFPELKQRLQNIMTPSTPSVWNRLTTAILVTTISAATFTAARAQQREGDAPKPASPEAQQPAAREGEKPKPIAREGDGPARKGERDGDRPREGAREGDRKRAPREGEGERKPAARDGEQKKEGARDGDQPRKGPRDGEVKREGPRDGEQPRRGPRDGEMKKEGARDGEGAKMGPREGEVKREGARDGENPKAAERDGEGRKAEGEKPDAR